MSPIGAHHPATTTATTGDSPAGGDSPGTVTAAAAAAPAAPPRTLSSLAAGARSRPPAGPGASPHLCRPAPGVDGRGHGFTTDPGEPQPAALRDRPAHCMEQPSVCHSQGVPACPIGNHSACCTDELPQESPNPQRGFHFPPQGDSPEVTSATLHWTENPTLLLLGVSCPAQ